jgi:hypothetical protein
MDYLWHVTLTTGHSRRSPRSEVAGGIVEMIRPLLSGCHSVPGCPDLKLRRVPDDLSPGPPVWQIDKHDHPVVTFGLAVSEADLNVLTDALGVPAAPVEYPWLGVVIHSGVVGCTHSELLMLGDLERCLAWSWLERPVAHDGQNRIKGPWPQAGPHQPKPRRRKRKRRQ